MEELFLVTLMEMLLKVEKLEKEINGLIVWLFHVKEKKEDNYMRKEGEK